VNAPTDRDAQLHVVEYTDPACPWAWGSEPKFRKLRAELGPAVHWRRVFGILFDDGEAPAPDPAAEAAWYLTELAEISGYTGAPYPDRLFWVARSSWPASLAAKAAERQGPEIADAVLNRLRETTFVHGTPQRCGGAYRGWTSTRWRTGRRVPTSSRQYAPTGPRHASPAPRS
jgi:predicted DsbA family dithiol-disulfide isomerase